MSQTPVINDIPSTLRWYDNPAAQSWRCDSPPTGIDRYHATLTGYAPTALTELPLLAEELNVGRVFVKDESTRFGLGAFKALGSSWAIFQTLSKQLDVDVAEPTFADVKVLLDRSSIRQLVTATDGNHGRGVAHIARLLKLEAQIFLPDTADEPTVAAIRSEGAQVMVIDGHYDIAVRQAAEAADNDFSILMQDTAWPGYEEIPGWIVDGYSTLFSEIDAQLRVLGVSADLVTAPIGVGSLAQAAVMHYKSKPDGERAALLGIEPDTATAVLTSLVNGQISTVETGSTIMAGLNCGTPSYTAWPYMQNGLDAVVAVTDEETTQAVGDLAKLGVSSGPSGASSLSGMRVSLSTQERREALGVHAESVVVILSTEARHKPLHKAD